MPSTINLVQASAEQLQDFLDSFDTVMSDCDGVIWHLERPIPGAMKTLNKFQELGKKVYFVTNNSTISIEKFCEKFAQHGLYVKPAQIVNTAQVISWYLKNIEFSGEALVIAQPPFRQILEENGIKLVPERPRLVLVDPKATVKAVQDQPSIKAVIVDFSLDFDWANIALAVSCLRRKDVLYIAGAQDEWIICDANKKVLGPGPMINVITQQSSRTPIVCAKPSEILKGYILNKCNVTDPKKCLFIGDTVSNDMKFGTLCGFKKLFVDTGVDNINDAKKNQETCPDFYIPSLGLLEPIIDSFPNHTAKNKDS